MNNFDEIAFNATLVTPPDKYITEDSPKIFLLGTGNWKQEVLNHFSNEWLDDPIVLISYENETTFELLEWIQFYIQNSDFILLHIEELQNQYDIFFVGLLATKPNVFLSCPSGDNFETIRSLFNQFNYNIIANDPKEHLEMLKKIWLNKKEQNLVLNRNRMQ